MSLVYHWAEHLGVDLRNTYNLVLDLAENCGEYMYLGLILKFTDTNF